MVIILTIYILFTIINIIICSILTYIDYNNGIAITLGDIFNIFIIVIFSLLGTIWIIISILNRYNNIVILQKKKVK